MLFCMFAKQKKKHFAKVIYFFWVVNTTVWQSNKRIMYSILTEGYYMCSTHPSPHCYSAKREGLRHFSHCYYCSEYHFSTPPTFFFHLKMSLCNIGGLWLLFKFMQGFFWWPPPPCSKYMTWDQLAKKKPFFNQLCCIQLLVTLQNSSLVRG